jgi:NTE family protein
MKPTVPSTPWKPRIGLALGSGVARGWTHIGILRGLKRHNIQPDIYVGASIGALVGGVYLAGQLDNLEEWARGLNRRRIVTLMDFKMRSGSLIGGEKLARTLVQYLGDIRIEDLPKPFIAVAADLVNGHEMWLRDGSLVDALRASYALPGVFPPLLLNHHWMVDGALVNPIPVSVCTALGADITIAVTLQDEFLGKVRQAGSAIPTVAGFDLLDGVPGAEDQVEAARRNPIARRAFRREPGHPSLFGTMVSSLAILQDRVSRARLAADPPDILMKPRVGHIGLLEFDRAAELIEAGEQAVERALPRIRDVFQSVTNSSL